MKSVCKCVGCGRLMRDEDVLIPVLRIDVLNGRLAQIHAPTCSPKCAEKVKTENVEKLKFYLDLVVNQSQKPTTVNKYLGR